MYMYYFYYFNVVVLFFKLTLVLLTVALVSCTTGTHAATVTPTLTYSSTGSGGSTMTDQSLTPLSPSPPSPTRSPSKARSMTDSQAFSPTDSESPTIAPSPTRTSYETRSATSQTPSPTDSAPQTTTFSVIETQSKTHSMTDSQTSSPTDTKSATITPSPTGTGETMTGSPSPPSPTQSASETRSTTNSISFSDSDSMSSTITPSLTISGKTATSSASPPTPTQSPSGSFSATESASQTASTSVSVSTSETRSTTNSISFSDSDSMSSTITPSPTESGKTATSSPSPPTPTQSPSGSFSATGSASHTASTSVSVSSSGTLSATKSISFSTTGSSSSTLSPSPTKSGKTATSSPSPPTPTQSFSGTFSTTMPLTTSLSLTSTQNITMSETLLITPSVSVTFSQSRSQSRSPSESVTIRTVTVSSTPSLFISVTQVLTPSKTVTYTQTVSAATKTKSAGTPTASATPSTTVSHTTSNTLSATESESRVLAPPALTPFVGSARTPYIHRYYYYPPARFVGTYSGIPLVFSKTFHHLHSRRFLTTSALGRVVRFTLDNFGGGSALNSNSTTRLVSSIVAIVNTGGSSSSSSTSSGSSNQYEMTIGAHVFPVSRFARLQNRTALTNHTGDFACGDLMTAATVTAAVAVSARVDITITANPVKTEDAGASLCGPAATTTPLSGILYTEGVLAPAAQLSFATLINGFTNNTDERGVFLTGWHGPVASPSLPSLQMSGAGVEFPVFIGNPLQTTTTPFPVTPRTMVTAYPQSPAERSAMRIAADTTDAMLCTVGDTLSYAGRYVSPGEVLNSGGFPFSCFAFDTVEAMHAACDAAPACTGFTTVVMPAFPNATTVFNEIQGKELPLCLYGAGANPAEDAVVYQRMLYTKPTQGLVTCAVPVARSGRVAVYIQQTSLSSGMVVVRLNSKIAAQCGRERLFANGFGGLDGQCGGYALCAVLDVMVNATIDVAAPNGLQQVGCRNSLGVIVEQIAVDAVQRIDPSLIPIARLDVAALPKRAVTRPHGTGEALHLFVFAATHAALDVVQTGFSCALAEAAFGSNSCPASAIHFASKSTCQVCGGRAGFYSSGRPGRSDECSTRLFCGDFLPLSSVATGPSSSTTADTCIQRGSSSSASSSSAPYTGVVSVAMNFSRIAQQTDACSGLIATVYARPVYARPSDAGTSAVPVFPLLGLGTGLFQILLGVPLGSSLAAAGAHLGNAGLGSHLTRLLTVGPVGGRMDAYYVPWTSLLQSFNRADDTWQQRLQANTTLLCVVDHHGGAPSRCAFPVPRGATKVRVRASQVDFATKAMTVVFQTGRYPAATASVTCGHRKRFSGALGGEGRCDGFETCTDQYIYALDTYADEATGAHVVVELPADLEYRGCNLTATIIADFSRPLIETAPCPEFECPGERRCIPFAAVCDQVNQCARGTDEEACYTLHSLPNEMFCRSKTQRRIAIASDYSDGAAIIGPSLADCRRAAVARQSPAFTLHNGSCIVYGGAEIIEMFDRPSAYICNVTGSATTTTYMYLSEGVAQFRLCRASVHCSGNGELADGSSGADGASCTCACFEGFSGDSCADRLSLETIANIVVALPVATLADSIHLSRNVIAAALRLGSSTVGVVCTDITAMNDTAVYVACAVSSLSKSSDAYFHSRILLSPQALEKINTALVQQYHPRALLVTTRSLLKPIIPFGACNGTAMGGGTLDATACPVANAFERIRIASVENRSVVSMRVTVTDSSSQGGASTSSSRSRREFACKATSTTGAGGCITSTCDVAVAGSASSRITVSDVVFADATPLTTTCVAPALQSSGIVTIGSLPVVTNTTARNALEDFTPFFIGGIIVFIGGSLILFVLSGIFWCLYRKRMHETRIAYPITGAAGSAEKSVVNPEKEKNGNEENEQTTTNPSVGDQSPTPVVATMYELLIRQFFEQQCQREGRLHPKRWAFGLLIVGLACGFLAAFLTIYFKTAYGIESNFSVLYEEYSDSQCQASDISSVPRRIFAVAPGTYECTKMQAAGESVGAVYALGRCTGSEGNYKAVIRVGGSLGTCGAAPEVTLPSGQCVPLAVFAPGTTRNVFVSLTCSDAARIGARIAKLDALTKTPDEMVNTRLAEPAANLQLVAPETSSESGAIYSAFLVGSSRQVSSSFAEGVVDAQATGADFDGNDDAQRIVLQSPECTFFVGDHSACLSAAANALRPLMGSTDLISASPLIPALAPTVADAPVGFLFGGFGTSQPETWIGASATAHRYYDVAGTAFDMGALFPANPAELEDGEGYSVSLYMRADTETLGFAYAVTDALENSADGSVYPLHRLARLIDSGQGAGSGAWYSHTYRVYHSLYVNGPGRSLIVAFADPDFAAAPVQLLEFDLVAIGMERVFNGLWHHIAIVFLVENSKARAQLMVDGETYYSKKGWSACVDTFPVPVAQFEPNGSMPVHNLAADSIRNRGLLVTGYFNGGIYALQAAAVEKANTDFLVEGTEAMRAHNPFPREPTLYLGLATVSVAMLFLITTVVFYLQMTGCCGSGDEGDDGDETTALLVQTAVRFYAAFDECRLKGASLFPGQEHQQQQPQSQEASREAATTGSDPFEQENNDEQKMDTNKDADEKELDTSIKRNDVNHKSHNNSSRLLPLRFVTVLRWTGLTAEEMATVMDGIEQLVAEDSAAARMLLFVMQIRKNDPAMEAFSIAEWNQEVSADPGTAGRGLRFWAVPESDHDHEVALFKKMKTRDPLGGDDVSCEDKKQQQQHHQEDEGAEQPTQSSSTTCDASATVSGTVGAVSEKTMIESSHEPFADNDDDPKAKDGEEEEKNEEQEEDDLGDDDDEDVENTEEEDEELAGASASHMSIGEYKRKKKNKKKARRHKESKNNGNKNNKNSNNKSGNNNNKGHAAKDHTERGKTEQQQQQNAGDGNDGGNNNQNNNNNNEDSGPADEDGGEVEAEIEPPPELVSFFSAIINILAPVIATFQVVYVWMTSMDLPPEFKSTFRGVFSFFSVDFAATFSQIPTLVTPLLQLFIGLVAIGLFVHFVMDDNHRFEKRLAQYVWRRDEQHQQQEHAPTAANKEEKKKSDNTTNDNDSEQYQFDVTSASASASSSSSVDSADPFPFSSVLAAAGRDQQHHRRRRTATAAPTINENNHGDDNDEQHNDHRNDDGNHPDPTSTNDPIHHRHLFVPQNRRSTSWIGRRRSSVFVNASAPAPAGNGNGVNDHLQAPPPADVLLGRRRSSVYAAMTMTMNHSATTHNRDDDSDDGHNSLTMTTPALEDRNHNAHHHNNNNGENTSPCVEANQNSVGVSCRGNNPTCNSSIFSLPSALVATLADEALPEEDVEIEVLPYVEARKIDMLLGKISDPRGLLQRHQEELLVGGEGEEGGVEAAAATTTTAVVPDGDLLVNENHSHDDNDDNDKDKQPAAPPPVPPIVLTGESSNNSHSSGHSPSATGREVDASNATTAIHVPSPPPSSLSASVRVYSHRGGGMLVALEERSASKELLVSPRRHWKDPQRIQRRQQRGELDDNASCSSAASSATTGTVFACVGVDKWAESSQEEASASAAALTVGGMKATRGDDNTNSSDDDEPDRWTVSSAASSVGGLPNASHAATAAPNGCNGDNNNDTDSSGSPHDTPRSLHMSASSSVIDDGDTGSDRGGDEDEDAAAVLLTSPGRCCWVPPFAHDDSPPLMGTPYHTELNRQADTVREANTPAMATIVEEGEDAAGSTAAAASETETNFFAAASTTTTPRRRAARQTQITFEVPAVVMPTTVDGKGSGNISSSSSRQNTRTNSSGHNDDGTPSEWPLSSTFLLLTTASSDDDERDREGDVALGSGVFAAEGSAARDQNGEVGDTLAMAAMSCSSTSFGASTSSRSLRSAVRSVPVTDAELAVMENQWHALDTVGVRCQRHPQRRLAPQQQTSIWPFDNVPMCCLVVNGQRCGEACGTIYHCGHTHRSEADGQLHVCTYALCERHCRLSVSELVVARVLGLYREVRRHGLGWLFCFLVMMVANTAYTPFIKTALMILGCHPYYQCEFKQCTWGSMDQKYALAVYLSMVVVVVFGVGFPATLLVLLWQRRTYMRCLFLDPSYNGRYQQDQPDTAAAETAAETPSTSVAATTDSSAKKEEEEEKDKDSVAKTKDNSSSSNSGGGEISSDEWERFVSSDGSVLAREYELFYPSWMFITGIIVFFKILAMVPALFLEPRSFDQRLGIIVVEVVVALFFYSTKPQMNPLSMLALHSGCIYRILLAGLQSLSLVRQNDTGSDLTMPMVVITALYFIFNVGLIVTIVIAPVVRQRLRQRYMRALLNRHAIDYVDEISLYVDPLVRRNTAGGGVSAQ